MFKEILNQIVAGEHLTHGQAREAMATIMSGNASEAQIGAFLAALRMKGETGEEIAGFAETMRQFTVKVECASTGVIDTCGTGGDKKGTFNVSTTVALVVAGAGVPVAKHGNHGISSSCGSADVLRALGVHLELPPQAVAVAIDNVGVGFLYAPVFHPAMRHAGKPRRELGVRTVFNVLGPLTNPAGAEYQLLGVYEQALTGKLAEVLLRLGVRRAMVVHGLDGLDELSLSGPSQVSEVVDGAVRTYRLDPADYGLHYAGISELQGGTPQDNAALLTAILQGRRGPCRDIVLLNAAAALTVAEKAENIAEGLVLAGRSIDSGAALAGLEGLVALSGRYKEESVSL